MFSSRLLALAAEELGDLQSLPFQRAVVLREPKGHTFECCFRLCENETSVRTEVLAGVTTFLTMAGITAVQLRCASGAFAVFGG